MDASLTSFASIFLLRNSGVRPTIKPQMNTAKITYSRPFRSPTPLPPNTLFSIIWAMGTMPPSGVNDSCILLTEPVVAAVVTAVNSADSEMPSRTSLPSMFPWMPAASSAGTPRYSDTNTVVSITRNSALIAANKAHPCFLLFAMMPKAYTSAVGSSIIQTMCTRLAKAVGVSNG
ncbi:hypothetical protein D1872_242420 [compost metagenome]